MNLIDPIAEELDALERYIKTAIRSDVALVNQVTEHLVNSGGKRVRPQILILVARAIGYHGEHVISQGAMIEYIHTATLLHDDVVDQSRLRRGRATANEVFGNAASVLVGDFIYSRSFQLMLLADDPRILKIVAEVTNTIAAGEVMQLSNIGEFDLSEDEYYAVIEAKTSALFVAASKIGVMLADRADMLEAATEYGLGLGTAFQLMDDLLDYSADSNEMGKNVGADLVEGKPTLPLMYAYAKADPAMRAQIEAALSDPGCVEPLAIVDWVRRSGALEYTRKAAQKQAERALAAVDLFPQSDYARAMREYAIAATERKA